MHRCDAYRMFHSPLLIPVSELMEAYHEMEVELVRDERVHAELDRQRDAMEKLVGDLQAYLYFSSINCFT